MQTADPWLGNVVRSFWRLLVNNPILWDIFVDAEAERRRLQAIKDSKEQLLSIVQSWRMACSIEDFFEAVRLQVEQLPDEERAVFLERLEMARQMFGGIDALAHFRTWPPTQERR